MLVRELITDACYLSLNDEDFQPAISPGTLTSALRQFNLMLDELRDSIPYTFQYTFNDVDDLENTAFVTIDELGYIINNVIIPMMCVNLVKWREIAVVENLVGIPQVYFFDESTQTIRVYPRPANPDYEFIVNGRRALGPLALDDELPDNIPDYMKNTIMYELAFRLSGKFGVPWDEKNEQTRVQLAVNLKSKQVIDLRSPCNVLFPNGSPSVPPFPYFYYLSGGGR